MVRPEYPLTPQIRAALPGLPWHRPAERLGLDARSRLEVLDDGDLAYHRDRAAAFHALRPA